jgi:pilus assembly protein CpaB
VGRGISSGTLGIVVMAIMAGLVGAYIVRNSLLKEPVVAGAPPARLTVPLATTDLPAGRTLTLGDIGLVNMTRAEMHERGYDLSQTMMSPDQIIGRTLRDPILQGQPFITSALYLEGTRRDFTADLRPGYRAYSLGVPKDKGGSLPLGSMVDVFFRTTERKPVAPGDRGIPEVTLQLLQGVEIIDVYESQTPSTARAAGLDIRTINAPRGSAVPTITLAVTPEQAHVLQTASGRGEMTLVARPDNERLTSVATLKPKTLDDILGLQPAPQIVVFATEAYRRGQRSVNVYRDDRLVEELSRQPMPVSTSTVPPVDPTEIPPGNPGGTAVPVVPIPVPPAPVVPIVPAPAVPVPAVP